MGNYWFRKTKRKIGWALKNNPFARRLIIDWVDKKNKRNFNAIQDLVNTADKVSIDNCNLRIGIVKDEDVLSLSLHSYWPKFERFAKNNKLSFCFVNLHADDWIKAAENLDVVLWRPLSNPSSLYEERTKIAYLEKFLKISCYPSSEELWLYEDKIRQYFHMIAHNLPVIPTFISFDERECFDKLDSFNYPLIGKAYIWSGSLCVTKINNKTEAKRHIARVFAGGLETCFPYFKQKGYVYFQKYIDDATFDLRIILVGEMIFGYYRMRPKHDFRASGAGLIVYNALPLEAVLLAKTVKEKMPSTILAVDLLNSVRENKFYIIETSIAIDIDTLGELFLKDIPGYYILKDGVLEFHEGKFWLQELTFKELLMETMIQKGSYKVN